MTVILIHPVVKQDLCRMMKLDIAIAANVVPYTKMKPSKLFTTAELKALNKRLEGDKKDPTGIYASRVKPKLKEILEWNKNTIRRLLK